MSQRHHDRYRWRLLAGVWSVYAVFGLVAGSMAPLLDEIRTDLGVSRTAIGAALGAWPLVYLAVALPAGRFLDRVGLRVGLTVGAGIIGCSGVLRAVSTGGVTLWLAVAVFGIGGPLVSVGAPKLVSDWFGEQDRGTAVGIYSTASSTGTMLALLVAEPVLLPLVGSWRWVVGIFGVVAMLVGTSWWFLAHRLQAPKTVGDAPREPAAMLLRLPGVRAVLVLATGIFFIGHGLNGWMPALLRDGGWSPTRSSLVVAAGVIVGICGSLVVPRWAGRTDVRRTLTLLFAGLAGTLLALNLGPDGIKVGAVLGTGLLRVSLVPTAMLLLMAQRDVEPSRMGAAGGLFFTAGEIGGVTGPLAVGAARDMSSDFTPALLMLAAVAVALALVTVALRRSVAGDRAAHTGVAHL